MRIAGIQMHCVKNKLKNIEKAKGLLEVAAERGAKIVCFPEMFNLPWFPFDVNKDNFRLAETADGETISIMREAAKKYKVALILPIFEVTADLKYYNTTFIIGPGGGILGKYQKIHIPQIPYWEEKYYFSTGTCGFPVFKVKGVKIGILTCWDNFFPEAARILALKGARVLFCPTAAAFATQSKWEIAIRANSMVNGIYSLRVNRAGKENDILNFYGKSFCAGPDGKLVGDPAGSHEGVFLSDVDVNSITQSRKTWSFFKERKRSLYSEILDVSSME